ncbi:hypothetical protein E4U12_007909, partial [Claviceps purpurea]
MPVGTMSFRERRRQSMRCDILMPRSFKHADVVNRDDSHLLSVLQRRAHSIIVHDTQELRPVRETFELFQT